MSEMIIPDDVPRDGIDLDTQADTSAIRFIASQWKSLSQDLVFSGRFTAGDALFGEGSALSGAYSFAAERATKNTGILIDELTKKASLLEYLAIRLDKLQAVYDKLLAQAELDHLTVSGRRVLPPQLSGLPNLDDVPMDEITLEQSVREHMANVYMNIHQRVSEWNTYFKDWVDQEFAPGFAEVAPIGPRAVPSPDPTARAAINGTLGALEQAAKEYKSSLDASVGAYGRLLERLGQPDLPEAERAKLMGRLAKFAKGAPYLFDGVAIGLAIASGKKSRLAETLGAWGIATATGAATSLVLTPVGGAIAGVAVGLTADAIMAALPPEFQQSWRDGLDGPGSDDASVHPRKDFDESERTRWFQEQADLLKKQNADVRRQEDAEMRKESRLR